MRSPLALFFLLGSSATAFAQNLIPVLNGAPVEIGVGAYPRAIVLSDGSTILGTYTGFDGETNIINIVQSTNQGASWTQVGTVTEGVGDIDNPYLLQLTDGTILCAFRNNDRACDTCDDTYYRITVCSSSNLGVDWVYLSTVEQDVPSDGDWEPFLRQAANGDVQVYWAHEDTNEVGYSDQDIWMKVSTDGGATWGSYVDIAGYDLDSRDGMPGVATISGEDLVCVFESDQNGLFQIDAVYSSDDGATWGDRTEIYAPSSANGNAGGPQVVNVGGTMVMSFMTDEDSTDPDWDTDAQIKIVTSSDGVTWRNKLTIQNVLSEWAGMVVIDDATLLVMYDYDGTNYAQKVSLGAADYTGDACTYAAYNAGTSPASSDCTTLFSELSATSGKFSVEAGTVFGKTYGTCAVQFCNWGSDAIIYSYADWASVGSTLESGYVSKGYELGQCVFSTGSGDQYIQVTDSSLVTNDGSYSLSGRVYC